MCFSPIRPINNSALVKKNIQKSYTYKMKPRKEYNNIYQQWMTQ